MSFIHKIKIITFYFNVLIKTCYHCCLLNCNDAFLNSTVNAPNIPMKYIMLELRYSTT